jgi:tRNA (mo5U34)-methyltransferase
MDRETADRLVSSFRWHHDFEIVPGTRTRGSYDPASLYRQLRLPEDLTGVRLADVGASNGYFSFQARKNGADVTAFDYRHRDNSGFALAQHLNGMSEIPHHQVNVLHLTAAQYGTFDIVLALGLLYHVSDPYLGLCNCASLCKGVFYLQSYCIDREVGWRMRRQPIMRFISDPLRFPQHSGGNTDRSNFWGFTSTCLERMIEDVGFRIDRTEVTGDRVLIRSTRVLGDPGKLRLNLAHQTPPVVPLAGDPDDPKAWVLF